MEILRLKEGYQITQFESRFALHQSILTGSAAYHVNLITLSSHGRLGYHRATEDQLFLVLHGQGWVRDKAEKRLRIREGMAAFWGKGEWHESGSDEGLVAVVIEGSDLQISMEAIPPNELDWWE